MPEGKLIDQLANKRGGWKLETKEKENKSCVPIKYVYLRYDIQSMFMR